MIRCSSTIHSPPTYWCKIFKWEKISEFDRLTEYILVDISILFLCSYIWCRGWRSWTCPCPRCWRPRRSRGRCWRWTASGARGCGCPWSPPPAHSAAAPRPEWGTHTKKLFLFRKNISSLAEKYLVHHILLPVIALSCRVFCRNFTPWTMKLYCWIIVELCSGFLKKKFWPIHSKYLKQWLWWSKIKSWNLIICDRTIFIVPSPNKSVIKMKNILKYIQSINLVLQSSSA